MKATTTPTPRWLVTLSLLVFLAIISCAVVGSAQMMGPQRGWYCPMCGQWMGPGGWGMGAGWGHGYGMGRGMMHPGYPIGPQYQWPQRLQLEEKDAKALVEEYLQSTRNPNLKLGKIEDKGTTFEAEILTKDGSLVDKVAIDKSTGWMRSVY